MKGINSDQTTAAFEFGAGLKLQAPTTLYKHYTISAELNRNNSPDREITHIEIAIHKPKQQRQWNAYTKAFSNKIDVPESLTPKNLRTVITNIREARKKANKSNPYLIHIQSEHLRDSLINEIGNALNANRYIAAIGISNLESKAYTALRDTGLKVERGRLGFQKIIYGYEKQPAKPLIGTHPATTLS